MPMHEADVFVLADRALNDVVQQIKDDQWTMLMPSSFSTQDPNKQVSLYQVITHHAYDDAWVPDMLAGRTMDEVGRTKYDGNILGDDPRRKFAELVERACIAAMDFENLDEVVHCSFGDFPAREYLWQINSFRFLRSYDLGRALDLVVEMPSRLVEAMWEGLSPRAEQWRSFGVFGAAVQVPADASLEDRLLGMTGRPPMPGYELSPEATKAMQDAIQGARELAAMEALRPAGTTPNNDPNNPNPAGPGVITVTDPLGMNQPVANTGRTFDASPAGSSAPDPFAARSANPNRFAAAPPNAGAANGMNGAESYGSRSLDGATTSTNLTFDQPAQTGGFQAAAPAPLPRQDASEPSRAEPYQPPASSEPASEGFAGELQIQNRPSDAGQSGTGSNPAGPNSDRTPPADTQS